MLANSAITTSKSGALNEDVHLPGTSLYELIDFISAELPHWRDRPERPAVKSETALTSQLCAHLNSSARHSVGWDFLQFRIEEPDEVVKGRKIDLVPAPCGTTVWIEGRKHVDFDILLPIECKRLPTPKASDRDEREYVVSQYSTTGGIQRFKEGHHGAAHSLCAMIAYVQENPAKHWDACVCKWINELVDSGQTGWNAKDVLYLLNDDPATGIAVLRSTHSRPDGLPDIEIRHLWVCVN
ncbi:hypothetical protein SAMN05444166_5135 [Singulisphaera sp. GP187]|nr:hypothetical protein SAMN05444166_5135 [Singulisphaera sp. GP187]